jgi:uncharacterized iron-regulated membrane protein
MRRFLSKVHLYLGLVCAIYAIAIGLSGSVLVFEEELTRAAYPQFSKGRIPSPLLTTPDNVLFQVRAKFPGWTIYTLTWPVDGTPFWMSYLLKGNQPRQVFVDPQTGKVAGDRDPSAGWLGLAGRLHSNLLIRRAGRSANGIFAGGLLLLSATGVALWWPTKPFGWRIRELHYGAGIIAALYLILLSITGLYFVTPQIFIKMAGLASDVPPEPRLSPHPRDAPLLTVDGLAAKAQGAIPDRPIYRVEVVNRPDQPVRVTFREGEPEAFHLVSTVYLDPVTGNVIGIKRLADRRGADSVLGWLAAVHFGRFGGLPVKILWASLGLTLPLLAITGFLMWWKKMAVSRARKPEVVLSR